MKTILNPRTTQSFFKFIHTKNVSIEFLKKSKKEDKLKKLGIIK